MVGRGFGELEQLVRRETIHPLWGVGFRGGTRGMTEAELGDLGMAKAWQVWFGPKVRASSSLREQISLDLHRSWGQFRPRALRDRAHRPRQRRRSTPRETNKRTPRETQNNKTTDRPLAPFFPSSALLPFFFLPSMSHIIPGDRAACFTASRPRASPPRSSCRAPASALRDCAHRPTVLFAIVHLDDSSRERQTSLHHSFPKFRTKNTATKIQKCGT